MHGLLACRPGHPAQAARATAMMFLSELSRRLLERRAEASFLSEMAANDGEIALFNKNDWTTWHVRATPAANYHGWWLDVVESDVPPYWRRAVVPQP